jgi:hypothetical protein
MAVAKFVQLIKETPGVDLLRFLGKRRVGRRTEDLEGLCRVRQLAADCFHGGRNECFEHGIVHGFSTDWDLKGAYTSALAMFREVDWANIEFTTDLRRLTQLDTVAFALVEFEFPSTTRFPSLPVDVDPYGLIYPLAGRSFATGPELLVALKQGATINVIVGAYLPWLDPNGPRPFLSFAQLIATERTAHEKGSPQELMMKEAGNSLYGKAAQAVASFKTPPCYRRTFDSRTGCMEDLPPSKITQPVVAALTTGLLRGVLSEILASLPDDVTVYTATTDGWLSTATEEEVRAATSGSLASYYLSLRAMVDTTHDPDILEMKHSALGLIVAKTRGTFTTKVGGPMPKPIIARAGHRLENNVADEPAEWERIFRTRCYDTLLRRKQFIGVREQWYADADLIEKTVVSRANLDYDLKRKPVGLRDYDGLVRFGTEPWPDIDAFLDYRTSFGKWRESAKTCLKTVDDWHKFLSWKQTPRSGSASSRTQFENAVVAGFAKGLRGFPVRSRGRHGSGFSRAGFARLLTSCGVTGVNSRSFDNSRRRDPDPTGSVNTLMYRLQFLGHRVEPYAALATG